MKYSAFSTDCWNPVFSETERVINAPPPVNQPNLANCSWRFKKRLRFMARISGMSAMYQAALLERFALIIVWSYALCNAPPSSWKIGSESSVESPVDSSVEPTMSIRAICSDLQEEKECEECSHSSSVCLAHFIWCKRLHCSNQVPLSFLRASFKECSVQPVHPIYPNATFAADRFFIISLLACWFSFCSVGNCSLSSSNHSVVQAKND